MWILFPIMKVPRKVWQMALAAYQFVNFKVLVYPNMLGI